MMRVLRMRLADLALPVAAFALLLMPTVARGQQDFDDWLNREIAELVAARMAQTSHTNQVEIPSLGANSTALVDQASASDFVGVGVNPITLLNDGGDELERVTRAFTINPYVVYAALASPRDPLRPSFYRDRLAQVLRKFSITVGSEELESNDASVADRRATILGLKFLSWNERDLDRAEQDELIQQLRAASREFTSLRNAVIDSLFLWTHEELDFDTTTTDAIRFRNALSANLTRILESIGPQRRGQIDRMIEAAITPFEELQRAANDVAAEVRKSLQLSLAVFSKTGQDIANEYRASAIVEIGPKRALNVTLNGSFEFREATAIDGDDHYGASVAALATFQLTGDDIFGTQPATFSVSGRWKKLDGIDAIYAIQGKLSVPLVNGVTLPISVTYASDPELVEEDEVLGRVGLTIDTARLLKALQP